MKNIIPYLNGSMLPSNLIKSNFQIVEYEPKNKRSEDWIEDNSIEKMNELRIKNGLKPLE